MLKKQAFLISNPSFQPVVKIIESGIYDLPGMNTCIFISPQVKKKTNMAEHGSQKLETHFNTVSPKNPL